MKKFKLIHFMILGAAVGFSSCKKDYLNTAPTGQVADESLFSTTTNSMIALNGLHRIMWNQYFNQDEAGHGSMMINVDNLGEDLINNSTSTTTFFQALYRWDAHRNANS